MTVILGIVQQVWHRNPKILTVRASRGSRKPTRGLEIGQTALAALFKWPTELIGSHVVTLARGARPGLIERDVCG